MSLICRAVSRVSQPDGPVNIDQSMFPGAELAYLPSCGINIAKTEFPVISGSVILSAGPPGIAAAMNGVSYISVAGNNSDSFTAVFSATVMSTAVTTTISQSSFSGSSESSQQIRVFAGGAIQLIRAGVANIMAGGTVIAGVPFNCVVSWDNVSGSGYIAIDGRLVATRGAAVQSWSSAGIFVLGRRNTGNLSESNPHELYLYARSDLQTGVDKGLSLSANPWKIFAPHQRPMWLYTPMSYSLTANIESQAITSIQTLFHVESPTLTSATATANAEALTPTTATATANAEALAMLSTGVTLQAEALLHVRYDGALSIEVTATISKSSITHVEALQSVTGTATLSAEMVQAIARAMSIPVEALQVGSVNVVVNLINRTALFQVLLNKKIEF